MPEAGELELELPGRPGVVGVEQSDEVTPAQGDPPVAGRGDASVLVEEIAYTRVARVGPLDQVARAVGRAVVEDENLGVPVRLRADTVDRSGQRSRRD